MFDQVQSGFGANGLQYGQREVEELAKALTAGYGYAGAPGSLTGGSELMIESLEYTLHSVTWDDRQLKIWPIMPREEVWNTVHEYQRYTSHGQQLASGGFFDADAQVLPVQLDPQFNRQVVKVRYMGITEIVTHPMTLVRTSTESAVAVTARAGTKWILEQMERQIHEANDMYVDPTTGQLTGNPNSIPASSLKFNGLGQQITYSDYDPTAQYTGWDGYGGVTSSTYDLEGEVMGEEDLEAVSRYMAENFGIPTHAIMSYKFHSDLNRQMQPKERITPMGVINGQAGFVYTQFYSSAGIYNMVGSKFLNPKQAPVMAQLTSPGSPTFSLSAVTLSGQTSNYTAGTYSVRVSALNNVGEGTAAAQQTVAITAGQFIQISITAADGAGITPSNAYGIYVAPVGQTTGQLFVGFIYATAGDGVGAVGVVGNFKLPGLETAYLLQMTPEEITFMQLAPLMKLNLAVISPAIRFMVMIYGMVIAKAPKHHMVIRNGGRL